MIDYQQEIESILQCLANGGLAMFPTTSNWVIAVDATNYTAVEKLNNIHKNYDNQQFIIYFSDERMMMQHVASIDLELFNFLDQQNHAIAIFSNHILGVAENALDSQGAAFTLIAANDNFTKTIIKRFRKPLFVLILPKPATNNSKELFTQIPDNLKKVVNYVFSINEFQSSNFEKLELYKLIDNQLVVVSN